MARGLREDTEEFDVHDRVPRPAQSQGHLLNEVVHGVHVLIRQFALVKINAFFCDFQHFQVGATKAGNGNQVVSPDRVTCKTEPNGKVSSTPQDIPIPPRMLPSPSLYLAVSWKGLTGCFLSLYK